MELEERLFALRLRLYRAPIDPALLAAVQALPFGGDEMRFRSSTNVEDLPEFSGAGLYTSAGGLASEAEAKIKVVWANSWYDPAKAAEYTSAQIATGADLIFQLTGNFKPCEEAKILCFGNFQDQHSFSPSTVLSSTIAQWDPDVNHIIDAWWAHKAEGKPYAGNTEKQWISMKDGGAAMAPYGELESKLPQDVRGDVEALKAKIMAGSFEVPLDVSDPKAH